MSTESLRFKIGCTLKTNPYFRYEGKTGKERNLVIFKDKSINNHINPLPPSVIADRKQKKIF